MSNWIKDEICPTGWEYKPDGDCVGSVATKKCYDRKTIVSKNGPKSLKWEGTRWMKFPSHICVSNWECNSFNATVPTFTTLDEMGKTRWSFHDKDNKMHHITESTRTKEILTKQRDLLCVLDQNYPPTIHLDDAECFSENIDNIKCIVRGSGKFKGIVFDVSKSGDGVLRNLAFEIIGPLLVLIEDKIKKYKCRKTPRNEQEYKYFDG